jgi:hypothetical protein
MVTTKFLSFDRIFLFEKNRLSIQPNSAPSPLRIKYRRQGIATIRLKQFVNGAASTGSGCQW